jgi:hypothetical protein
MRVLLFNSINQFGDETLSRELKGAMPFARVVLCRTMDDLFLHLRSMENRPHVVVLSLDDKSSLVSMVESRELFSDVSIVLLLPNQDKDLLTLAHRLRPRFIDFFGSSRDGLVSVLKKLTRPGPGKTGHSVAMGVAGRE